MKNSLKNGEIKSVATKLTKNGPIDHLGGKFTKRPEIANGSLTMI